MSQANEAEAAPRRSTRPPRPNGAFRSPEWVSGAAGGKPGAKIPLTASKPKGPVLDTSADVVEDKQHRAQVSAPPMASPTRLVLDEDPDGRPPDALSVQGSDSAPSATQGATPAGRSRKNGSRHRKRNRGSSPAPGAAPPSLASSGAHSVAAEVAALHSKVDRLASALEKLAVPERVPHVDAPSDSEESGDDDGDGDDLKGEIGQWVRAKGSFDRAVESITWSASRTAHEARALAGVGDALLGGDRAAAMEAVLERLERLLVADKYGWDVLAHYEPGAGGSNPLVLLQKKLSAAVTRRNALQRVERRAKGEWKGNKGAKQDAKAGSSRQKGGARE